MLRSRSKRSSSWGCGRSELPMSETSRPPLPPKHRFSESTSWRGNGIVYRISRCLKPLFFLLVLILVLLLILYVWITNASAREFRAQFFTFGTSKASPNSTMYLLFNSDRKALPRGKPPMVDRSILDKLALMDQTADDPDERPASSVR